MPSEASGNPLWPCVARFIAMHLGLSFPPERETDLLRGLRGAAQSAGFDSAEDYAEWLLSRPPLPANLHALATHLTIGETYFFREEQALRALSGFILPKLIAARRGKEQYLRLWSAACSTGEEAYSLAIMLQELLPDWSDWRITVLATDINTQSLEKAVEGVYGEWSFRTLPADIRARYFTAAPDRRFAVCDTVKRRVNFVEANLAADGPPEFPAEASNMDVILCRNLLIYFTAEQGQKLVNRLHAALVPGGSLVVSPSECSQQVFSRFVPVNYTGMTLYRKPRPDERPAEPAHVRRHPFPAATSKPVSAPAPAVARETRLQIPATPLRPAPAEEATAPVTNEHAARARLLANQGNLSDALAPCEQWINADKVDPAAHYLHATVLQELGDRDGARRSLQRCIYLQPDFALAHFALGNLARGAGRHAEAQRHYRNAQRLLDAQPADAPLPESEGLTAGRVAAIIRTLLDASGTDTTGSRHGTG